MRFNQPLALRGASHRGAGGGIRVEPQQATLRLLYPGPGLVLEDAAQASIGVELLPVDRLFVLLGHPRDGAGPRAARARPPAGNSSPRS